MEFEILLQYYEELTGALENFIHRLHSELQKVEIITHDDEYFMWKYDFVESDLLLLTRIAHHILSGKTNLFYKFLEIMQNHKDCQYLGIKIIISLDQKMLIGMLIVV